MPMIVRVFMLPLLLAAVTADAAAGYRSGRVLCTFQDAAITESSGLAASARSDAYFWTHNDSGDAPRIFAVNRQGLTLATLRLTGADAIDWEDMARGKDPQGQPLLWLGDIGDNNAVRSSVFVYAVPEPVVDVNQSGVSGDLNGAVRYELRYPDGPRDAESLFVHPRDRRLYILSKSLSGSRLYVAPTTLRTDQPNTLKKVGSVNFGLYPNSAQTVKQLAMAQLGTAGDISPDGKRLVLRTYLDAYEWPVANADIAAAVRARPLRVKIPATNQGEAIAYRRDGKALFTSTEGAGSPVHEMQRR